MGKDVDGCCDACRLFGDPAKPVPPEASGTPARADDVVIVIEHRGERREVIPGKPRMTVGRDAKNDVVIRDSALSRVQCILTFGEDGMFVRDSGSTCGTFVDGRSAAVPTRLHVGATVYFGNTVLTIASR